MDTATDCQMSEANVKLNAGNLSVHIFRNLDTTWACSIGNHDGFLYFHLLTCYPVRNFHLYVFKSLHYSLYVKSLLVFRCSSHSGDTLSRTALLTAERWHLNVHLNIKFWVGYRVSRCKLRVSKTILLAPYVGRSKWMIASREIHQVWQYDQDILLFYMLSYLFLVNQLKISITYTTEGTPLYRAEHFLSSTSMIE